VEFLDQGDRKPATGRGRLRHNSAGPLSWTLFANGERFKDVKEANNAGGGASFRPHLISKFESASSRNGS